VGNGSRQRRLRAPRRTGGSQGAGIAFDTGCLRPIEDFVMTSLQAAGKFASRGDALLLI
jgi:hypothetical protein